MVISEAVKNATEWNKAEIENRAAWLIGQAVNRWPFLNVSKEQAQLYATEKGGMPKVPSKAQFRYVFSSGFIKPDDKLVPVSEKFTTVATVTEEGTIVLLTAKNSIARHLLQQGLFLLRVARVPETVGSFGDLAQMDP